MKFQSIERARQLSRQGMTSQAIEIMKQLLSEDPNEPLYHSVLADFLLEQGRLHGAEYEIKIALELDPNEAYIHETKAYLLLLKNKPKDALESAEEAMRLSAGGTSSLVLKSRVLRVLKQDKQAIEILLSALANEPNSLDALCELGEIYLDTGSLPEALEVARNALRINAESTNANLLMGWAKLRCGEVEEAEFHAKFVISRQPDNRDGLSLFASIKFRRNKIFGLLWKVNSMFSGMSNLKLALVLISGYLFFNLMSQVIEDLGFPNISTVVSLLWLAIVLYSWIGLPYFDRLLRKELEKFEFGARF